jgi:hypothetical protein
MPRIRCHYIDCVFVDEGYCSAAAVEFDPDTGCVTFSAMDESAKKEDEDWNEEDEEFEDWEEEDVDEEDDDWLDEEDEF